MYEYIEIHIKQYTESPADFIDNVTWENRDYGRRDPPRWPRNTLYPQKLALTSPTSGGRSVGVVRSQTKTTE
jgi:hypothetical protein